VAASLNVDVILLTVPVPDQLPPGPTKVRVMPLGPTKDISTSDTSSVPLAPAQLVCRRDQVTEILTSVTTLPTGTDPVKFIPGVNDRPLLTKRFGLSQRVTVDVCEYEKTDKDRNIIKINTLLIPADKLKNIYQMGICINS
jgi:hypothetical protein